MRARLFAIIVVLLPIVLTGCSHTTNLALCDPGTPDGASQPCSWKPEGGFRFDPSKTARKTLVVVTFSGGGIRASALAYGTLLALKELPAADGQGRLLDDVDIISSVSGGSVTAGWYALNGGDALVDDPTKNALLRFLRQGATASIAWAGLNPLALGSYLVTPRQRIDVLADYFADNIYGQARYRDVEARYRSPTQPFVILNASDVGNETGFAFTQGRFDLLCSDLASYRLADAVAASADFPIVFSATGLRNYSDDCRARGPAWTVFGAPQWLKYEAAYEGSEPAGTDTRTLRSNGLLQIRAARQALDYLNDGRDPSRGPSDRFLHLLDGGLVDNLGVLSTFAIEDDPACAPGLFQRLAPPRPPAYQKYDQILYIVVNARTRSPAGIDRDEYPPDEFSTLLRVIDTPLDSTILSMQNYLTADLQAILYRKQTLQFEVPSPRKTCWMDRGRPIGRTSNRAVAGPVADDPSNPVRRPLIVSLDFELIPDKRCRDSYWQLGTNWTLDRPTIDALIKLPSVMLRRSGELKDFYRSMGRLAPDLSSFPADFKEVCDAVEKGT